MKTVSKEGSEGTKNVPKVASSVATPDTKRGLGAFFADVQREMKKITWPTPPETTRLTSTVIGVCFLVAGVLFAFSLVIEQVFKLFLGGK